MKILYLSCHSINEYEDVKMLSELGHQVVSQGTYNIPEHPGEPQRPALPGMFYDEELSKLAITLVWGAGKVSVIPQELIDWCDAIYILGIEWWLEQPPNWERMKKKHVIFRSIGQSVPNTERILAKYRPEGLKIVRYSPLERQIPGYVGEDALIRFYKDQDEYKDWNGHISKVVTMAQSMKYRELYLHFSVFEKATRGLPRVLFGNGNEDAGELWGGWLNYEQLKQAYRDHRVFFYTGTMPAPYTMGFQEAFMTGMPVVSIGRKLAEFNLETPDFIQNGVNGYVSDDLKELYDVTKKLLLDYDLAKQISANTRKTALELFGKQKIKRQWKEFFEGL